MGQWSATDLKGTAKQDSIKMRMMSHQQQLHCHRDLLHNNNNNNNSNAALDQNSPNLRHNSPLPNVRYDLLQDFPQVATPFFLEALILLGFAV